jgi:anaerobic selenocysteine-containing dehydrogenase
MATTEDWRPTACILCECNCGLEVRLGGEDGRHLVRLRGDRRHPSSRGYACEKPHRLDHYQHGRDRVTRPLRRRADGTFEEIGWDVAIREVADRLAAVRDTHGGETIFYYGGGGQGNHLPGAYATATRRALGSRLRSSALAQEKTGDFWVGHRMMGSTTRADFEHCDVALFLGKNPWHSHSIPRARVTLQELSRDPARTLIVIDPRRTETAALADLHLQVRPGTDAWLLTAILGILLEDDLIDHAFLAAHAAAGELEQVRAVVARHPIALACARTGLDEALVRRAAHAIGRAQRLASFEDLGVQQNHHSTVVSYLHRLIILLTGSFGRPGTHYIPNAMVDFVNGEARRTSPVVGARLVGGLVPCNQIADEILTDHPARYRAMLVEAANPAHSLADGPRMREALAALDTAGGDRRRDDRDRAPGPLRPAGGQPVREGRGHVLQLRVPAQHVSPAAPAHAAARRHPARGRDPRAPGRGPRARCARTTSRRYGPRPRLGGPPTSRPSRPGSCPTRA